jgi:hypothetical protein
MTPEQKWLLIFGSGWVDWMEIHTRDQMPLFDDLYQRDLLELELVKNTIRLKQYESIRVHVAPSAGVRTI